MLKNKQDGMDYLNYPEKELKELGAYWTAKEIQQQPDVWAKTISILKGNDERTKAFLSPILAMDKLRIILTGAGTSAYIGSSIAPALSDRLGLRVEAIATTDLVSNPTVFFHKTTPTLLVSFARSGNSPESVAAVEYADELVDDCYQVALTCNADGALYQCCTSLNGLTLLMPEETNDRSLAMTSSFSSMLLAAIYLFARTEDFDEKLSAALAATASLLSQYDSAFRQTANKGYKRVVYLGSGVFNGLAQESALKLLELTDGQVISIHNSPLGFRHGPKAIVNDNTLVVVFVSNNSHTRKYDLALVNELCEEAVVGEIVAITAKDIPELRGLKSLVLEGMDNADEIFLMLPYVVCAQVYAFHNSLALGNSPDNPSLSGTINRVVQGVAIHAL